MKHGAERFRSFGVIWERIGRAGVLAGAEGTPPDLAPLSRAHAGLHKLIRRMAVITCSYGSSTGGLSSVMRTPGKNRREKPAQWQFTCRSQDLLRMHFEPRGT